jgi:hypothetical protein
VNIAEALERDRWPVYLVEAGGDGLAAVRLRAGALVPGVVAVRPGVEPPAWEAARLLLEEP